MNKQRAIAALATVLVLAACGGSKGPALGALCQTESERANVDGTEIICTKMQDAKLVWATADGSINSGGSAQGGQGASGLAGALGASTCEKTSAVKAYTAGIGDASKFAYIYPMGAMTGSHVTPVDHIYVYYLQDAMTHTVTAGSYLVTAPADGTVAVVEDFQKTNGYPYPDFRVVIAHSCDFFSVFIHVGQLSDGIAVGSKVTAGQTIADDSYSPGYDFSTFDSAVTLPFANAASYASQDSWKPHTANPFGYFPADVRASLESMSLRTSAPFDGKIDWDTTGTAQGNWFVKDTGGYHGNYASQGASFDSHGTISHGYWDTHLAIAPDAVDNSAFIYSIGDFEGCPCQFMTVGNVDPKSLTAGMAEPVVLQLVQLSYRNADGSKYDPHHPKRGYTLAPGKAVLGLLALQVMSDGTMKVEKLPGTTKASAFTGFSDKALIYAR